MRTNFPAFLPLMLFATMLNAQNPSGSLRGVVEDSTGSRFASALIDVTLASQLARQVSSDEHGEFRGEDLTPGSYRVSVSARGFATATADTSIAVAPIRDITVTMKPQSVPQTVGVQAQSSS